MAKKPKIQTRKPPTSAALEHFVAGGGLAAKARDGKTTTYTRKTGDSAGEDLRRVTLYFPTELHKRARIAAVEADVPLSEFVVHLVTKGLKK